MRVVFLHTDFRLYWRQRMACLRQTLAEQNHELHVVELADCGSPYEFAQHEITEDWWTCLFAGQNVEAINGKTARRAILGCLKKLRPDIVFAGAIAYPSGANAVKYCRDHRIPVVIFDDARNCDVTRGRITNWIKQKIYDNVDAVMIPAPSHLPDYRTWGFSEDNCYFGIDVVDNHYWEMLAGQAKLPENTVGGFLLGVGRQVEKKNWPALLQAYRRAAIKTPLLLIGNGPLRPALQQYITEQQLERQVTLIDFLTPPQLSAYYAAAAAVILPSLHGETWGLTVNEAMACGNTVLVSRACGCCDTLCIDGKTGICMEPTVDGMAAALKHFEALRPDEVAEMRRQAAIRIRSWGLECFTANVLKAITTLTAGPGRGYRGWQGRILVQLWKGQYKPV